MKNKILIPFVGDSIGGSHKSIIEIYFNLKKNNANIIFLLHKKNGPLAKYLNNQSILYNLLEVKKLSGTTPSKINIIYTNFLNFYKFVKFIKKNNITLIHCNDLRINLSWAIPALFTRTPLIWHQRTLISKSKWWKLIRYLSKIYIATSQSIKDNSPKNLKEIYLIPNPITLKKNYKIIQKYNEKKILILGYCGRIIKNKNIEYLIKNFAKVLSMEQINNKFELKLLIAGNGDSNYINHLNNLIKSLSCKKNVKFLGFVDNPYIFIEKLDILVCPSIIDGFGRTIIEAMSVRTPVIASNIGGHKDLIINNFNGLLFDPSKKNGLSNKIIEMIFNKDLPKKLVLNSENTVKKFDSKIIASTILQIYKKINKNYW